MTVSQKELFAAEDHIMRALSDVIDPEIGMNIVDLELIKGIMFVDSDIQKVQVHMVLTTPFCPWAADLLKQVKEKTLEGLSKAGYSESTAEVKILADRWVPPVGLF